MPTEAQLERIQASAAAAAEIAASVTGGDDPNAAINTPNDDYDRLSEPRALCADLMEGLTAIKRNAAKRLPRGPMEQPVQNPKTGAVYDPWETRRDNARYNGSFRDAVADLVGRVFAKEAKLAEETPRALRELEDDIDGEGNSLHVFMLESARRAVATGCDFILVDYPTERPAETRAQEIALGLRPIWRQYSAESVIDWRKERVYGRTRYSYLRMREQVEYVAPGREHAAKLVDAVRVIRAGEANPERRRLMDENDRRLWASWEVYEKVEITPGEFRWVKRRSGVYRNQIDPPFVCVPTDPVLREAGSPLLIDLAETVIVYIRKLSALDNAQAAVGNPMLYWEGANQAIVESQQATFQRLLFGPTGSHLSFVEPAGTSWGAIEETLDRMRDDMKLMAKEPTLTREPGVLTATGEAIRGAKAASTLQALALLWEDAISMALFYSGLYLKLYDANAVDAWGGVELNKRFMPSQQQVETLKAVLERNAVGKISDQTAWEVLQAFDAVPEGLTWDEEQDRIALDAPVDLGGSDESGDAPSGGGDGEADGDDESKDDEADDGGKGEPGKVPPQFAKGDES